MKNVYRAIERIQQSAIKNQISVVDKNKLQKSLTLYNEQLCHETIKATEVLQRCIPCVYIPPTEIHGSRGEEIDSHPKVAYSKSTAPVSLDQTEDFKGHLQDELMSECPKYSKSLIMSPCQKVYLSAIPSLTRKLSTIHPDPIADNSETTHITMLRILSSSTLFGVDSAFRWKTTAISTLVILQMMLSNSCSVCSVQLWNHRSHNIKMTSLTCLSTVNKFVAAGQLALS